MEAIANIHTAILAVYGQIGYVQKTRVGGLNYSFAGETALIAALRPAMIEAGIVMHVQTVANVEHFQFETAKGSVQNVTLIHATVRFTHAASGTFIDVQSIGEGADVGDKSGNKSMTGAYKYALRQTFCIETGDDPDAHASEPVRGKRETPRRTTTAAKPDPAPHGEAANEDHDPSWPDDRVPFCAALTEAGFKYDDVKAYCAAIKKPKPSALTNPNRVALYNYLTSDAGKEKFYAFMSAQEAKKESAP